MANSNIEISYNTYTLDISTTIDNTLDIIPQNIEHTLYVDSSTFNLEIFNTDTPTYNIDILQQSANTVEINADFLTNIYANNIIGINDYIATVLSNSLLGESGIYVDNNFNIGISGVDTNQIINVSSSASEINYLDLTFGPGMAENNKALVVNEELSISGINQLQTTGNAIIGGNLTVSGTQTTILSTSVEFADNVITINTDGLPAGGFRVYTIDGYRSLLWSHTNNRWEFSGGNIYTTGEFIGSIRGGTP